MNKQAERHLDRAIDLAAKGDNFHWQAGLEILAAQKADSTLSNTEIGRRMGRSKTWVIYIVRLVTTGKPDDRVDWHRGSHATKAEIQTGAEKLLETAPIKQIEKMLDKLPPKRKQAVAKALHVPTEIEQQAEEAKKKQKRERKRKHNLRYVEIEGKLGKMKEIGRQILNVSHDVEFDEEEQELLRHSLSGVKAVLELISLRLDGATDVDWDAELAKITEREEDAA